MKRCAAPHEGAASGAKAHFPALDPRWSRDRRTHLARKKAALLDNIGHREPQRTRIGCLSGLAVMHRSLTSRRRVIRDRYWGAVIRRDLFGPIKVELQRVTVNAATSTRSVKTHCVSAKHGFRR